MNKQSEQARERERTSAVELDGGLELDDGGGAALFHGGVELLQRLVVVGDVGLVVLLVMNLHDLTAYGRLQGTVVIGQVGQGEGLQPAAALEP